jgi:hypothetical protein
MADLRSWLLDQGFAILDDRYDSQAFGNQIVTFARPIAVRLVKDRSEWGVELLGPDGEWTWIGYWGGSRTSEPLSAADQSVRLRELLQAEGAESTGTTG